MWQRRGELLLHANSQTLSNIGNFLNEHGGVRGERLKKLFEFFYPLSLKDEVFKTER